MQTSFVVRPIIIIAGFILLASCARTVTTSGAPTPAPTSAGSSAAEAQASGARVALPATVTAQMIQQGDSIFNNGSCKRCHGMNGTNGRTAPDLTDSTWLHVDGSYESLVHIITTGVPAADFKSPTSRFPMRPKGGMPLTDAQVTDVAAYVFTLSHH
jgi:mono/diheme cytochrome c family protein